MSYVVFVQIYAESELLNDCLLSLEAQIRVPSLVVVVDDGTPDDSVREVTDKFKERSELNVRYFRGVCLKDEPNLETVGLSINSAYWWYVVDRDLYDYFSIIDVDTRPVVDYYEKIMFAMIDEPDIVCASGILRYNGVVEYLVSAKFIKRNDAWGSGKVMFVPFLNDIPFEDFPVVSMDTWINVRAMLVGKRAIQIPDVYFDVTRPSTNFIKADTFADGRYTYHFGYNWLLLLYKILTRGFGVYRGYMSARRENWKLKDDAVRKFFGWRYFGNIFRRYVL